MNNIYRTIIQDQCPRLEPISTGMAARLPVLDGIRAVLFDVYGSLFISASGEVGTATDEGRGAAFSAALGAVGLSLRGDPQYGVLCWLEAIRAAHAQAHAAGIEFPEVDIVQIWAACLERLVGEGRLTGEALTVDRRLLALHYEVRTNPTWPMPGMEKCLAELRRRGVQLGIISNAQFFTLELFPAHLGKTLDELHFCAELQFYSYRFMQAKPGALLYEKAAEALSARGLSPDNVVYLGNDLLNDVLGAHRVGFRTALFAGDARSLRQRDGDPRVSDLRPDLVVTHFDQLTSCL